MTSDTAYQLVWSPAFRYGWYLQMRRGRGLRLFVIYWAANSKSAGYRKAWVGIWGRNKKKYGW